MANCIDVADYILSEIGPTSAMKLQKLVYYSQAWHLVWEDKALFRETIEAWANGPVVPTLYKMHKGQFSLKPKFFGGKIEKLSEKNKSVIDRVLKFYADKDSQWLSELTHLEEPWKLARQGLPEGERGARTITLESMSEYYGRI